MSATGESGRSALNRRRLLAAGSLSALVAAACGGEDEDLTPAPTETPEPEPAATYAPITTPVPAYSDPTKWSGRTLAVAARGGDYQDAQEAALLEPFAAATGAAIQIKIAETDRLRDQVDSGEVSWDVLTLPMEDVLSLAQEGYLEPIDYAVVDQTSILPEVAIQHGVGAGFYSTVIVYPPDAEPPGGWADFWSVQPPAESQDVNPAAMRALRDTPVGNLEFALLADGVELTELYPLDIERAFASLERIRKNVLVWYEDGKQPVELVIAGQVGMASAWNVRPWQLGVADQVDLQWRGGMLSADAWVVPHGAPNADIAMDFINFATRAAPQANFGLLVPFGPVNPAAFDLLPPERARILPTSPANRGAQFIQNWNWWADNLEALTARFEEWLLTTPIEPGSPTAAAG